mmetsp:Transcript_34325/g.73151  ORF Transcript_34325/g.73151 Transcript_34325/m.73151 type:complete len:96 (-) Transcript_34325:170-457(-)
MMKMGISNRTTPLKIIWLSGANRRGLCGNVERMMQKRKSQQVGLCRRKEVRKILSEYRQRRKWTEKGEQMQGWLQNKCGIGEEQRSGAHDLSFEW